MPRTHVARRAEIIGLYVEPDTADNRLALADNIGYFAHSLVEREVYAEVPPRVEYTLSDLGKTLRPIIDSMYEWARITRRVYKTQLDGIY